MSSADLNHPLTSLQPERAQASPIKMLVQRALDGDRLTEADALTLIECGDHDLAGLLEAAATMRDRAKGRDVTYSRKVFLPVTNRCRDRCTYCTFRKAPGDPGAWTMTLT